MSTTMTPNMNLIVPGVGTEPGPAWATELNADLSTIDQHNHSAGSGVQITPTGININTDLPVNSNNLTTVKTIRFVNLSGSLAGITPNLGCLYEANNELYYNDGVGNVVKITTSGSVNAGAGSITGLPSGTASASFSGSTFTWQSATNTAANMDGGSFTFRQVLAGAHGITVGSPNSLAADYSLTWFAGLPGATSLVSLDSSGNFGTITYPIVAASIASQAVTTAKIANNAIGPAQKNAMTAGSTATAGNFAVSASCGNFTTPSSAAITNFSVTLTTTGRPVMLGFMDDGTSSATASEITTSNCTINLINSTLGTTARQNIIQGSGVAIPSSSIQKIDLNVLGLPGTYTYTASVTTSVSTSITFSVLYAYEI